MHCLKSKVECQEISQACWKLVVSLHWECLETACWVEFEIAELAVLPSVDALKLMLESLSKMFEPVDLAVSVSQSAA